MVYDYHSIDRARYLFSGQPVHIHWHGWRTNTHELHRNGWTLHCHEDYDVCTDQVVVNLAAVSEDKYVAIAGRQYIDHRMRSLNNLYTEEFRMGQFTTHKAEIVVQDSAQALAWTKLEQIDPYAPMEHSVLRFRTKDFKMFQRIAEPTPNEIYIPSDSVDECLNRILQLQYPDQKKKGIIMPEAKPILQARILSLSA